MKNCLLRCENLEIQYDENIIIRSADLSCHGGDIILLMGINGSGKTSLIDVMSGHVKAARGEVYFNEKEIKDLSWEERASFTSYLPQFIEKLDDLFVKDYLEMGLSKESPEVDKLLLRLEVKALLSKRMGILSGGELKKLAFYVAIKSNPEVLFLDEPFQNLDPQTKMIFKSILIDYAKLGNGIVMVSHDFIWSSELANKVYGVKDKTLVHGGKAPAFFSEVMNHPFVKYEEAIVPVTGDLHD